MRATSSFSDRTIGPVVLQVVVEQPQVDVLDRALRAEAGAVAQRPDDAEAAARHDRGERRQPRLEEAHVGIDRRAREAQRQVGVAHRRQRDPSAARDGEARRGAFELGDAHLVAAHLDAAGELAEPLLAGEEIDHAAAHAVARLVERAAAGRGEVEEAGQRQAREARHRQALDRDAPGVGVERIGAVPADERGAGDAAGRLAHVQRVEADARALEAQRRRRGVEGLAVGRAGVDLHAAEAERAAVRPVDAELARERAVDLVVVELEGVLEIVDRPCRSCGRARSAPRRDPCAGSRG